MKKKKSKSKLEKYILNMRHPFAGDLLVSNLYLDKNIKVLEEKKTKFAHIVWVEGFEEKGVFFVKYFENCKESYFYFSKES